MMSSLLFFGALAASLSIWMDQRECDQSSADVLVPGSGMFGSLIDDQLIVSFRPD